MQTFPKELTKRLREDQRDIDWLDKFIELRWVVGPDCIEDHYINPDDFHSGSWVSLDPGRDAENVEAEFRKLGLIVIYSNYYGLSLIK